MKTTPQPLPVITDSYEKGRLFEQYIITLFNERSFKLLKWRKSERLMDTSFSTDISYPDLELIFIGKRKYKFAIECKWRKEFNNEKINWATDYKLAAYEDFYHRFNIPVFIAIGIGGHPSAPEKLFVTPLQEISGHTDVYENELIPYKRKPEHKFFYDTRQGKLF